MLTHAHQQSFKCLNVKWSVPGSCEVLKAATVSLNPYNSILYGIKSNLFYAGRESLLLWGLQCTQKIWNFIHTGCFDVSEPFDMQNKDLNFHNILILKSEPLTMDDIWTIVSYLLNSMSFHHNHLPWILIK